MKKIVLFMFLLAAVACTKTDDLDADYGLDKNQAVLTRSGVSEDITEIISDDSESVIELSEPLDNPYAVATMQTAYNSLPAATRALAPNLTIATTHRYIKIPVTSEAILDALSEIAKRDDLEFSDYPMDRDIVNGGVPIEQEGVTSFLYASLPVAYSLPDTINYELIENLYIPDENLDSDEDNELTTRAGEVMLPKNFVIALVNKAMVMTDNEDYCYVPNTDPQTRAWRPAGRIEVWDDVKNGLIPLEGAKVRCRRWFTYHRGITNADGYYSCDGTYKRPGNYSIVWERAYWDIRSGIIGQALYNGPKIKGNWNLQITGGESLRYATIHRACFRWWYGDTGGLYRPDFSRSIKIMYSHKDGRSGYNLGLGAGIIRDIRIFGRPKGSSLWSQTNEIFGTTAHEVGHAMHSKHISRWDYWVNTRKFIKESFAVFAEYVITKKEYEALGLFEKIEYDDTSDSHIIGWYYPSGSPAWGSKKLPLYGFGQKPSVLNQNYWDLTWDPDDDRNYSPIFIDMMDRKNQRKFYNSDPIYPDDDIRGMSVEDIQYIAMRVGKHTEITAYLRNHIGKKYEEQIITDEMIQRYMEVYMRM